MFAGETKNCHRFSCLWIAAIVVLVFALMPAGARANSYLVKYCDRNQGTGLSSWEQIGWTNVVTTNSCSFATHVQQTGPLWSGDGTLAGDGRHGGFAWQLNRAGLRIYRYNVTTEGRTGDGYVSFQHCAAGGASCPLTSSQQVASGTKTIDIYPASGSDKRIEFRGICWTANPCGANSPDPGGENFDGYFYNLHMWIQDDSAPSVSSAFSSGGWVRGNLSIPTTGSDVGGGVQGTRAYFDNNLGKMTSSAASCPRSGDGSYTDAEPCPLNYNPTLTYNTVGNLGDGYHDGCVQSYDANNTPLYSGCHNISFKVDNTAPARPTGIDVVQVPLVEGSDWLSSRTVDLSWTNVGETVQTAFASGMNRIYYDINPAAGTTGQSNPPAAFVAPGSFNSLSDITMPSNGQWDVEVWATDAAGNTGPVGTITGVKVDDTQPDAPPMEANGWVNRAELDSGYEQTWFEPSNAGFLKSGICGYSYALNGSQTDTPDGTIDIPGNTPESRAKVLPATLADGTHFAHTRAVSCAGVPSAEVNSTAVPVDATVPGVETAGNLSGWSTSVVTVTATGSDALSGMAPAPSTQDVDRGASTSIQVNDATPTENRGATVGATIESDGIHTVKATTYDVARNATTKTVTVKIDRTAPAGGFEARDPNNPRAVKAQVSDATSGLKAAAIQIKPVGGGEWSNLPTQLSNGTLSTSIPDTKLPRGTYQFRVAATDEAGNTLTTSRMLDGSSDTYTVRTPLRGLAGITGGIDSYKMVPFKPNYTKCKKKKSAKQKRVCKRKEKAAAKKGKKTPIFVQEMLLKHNQPTKVRGVLRDDKGLPVANAPVDVYEQIKGGEEAVIGKTTTDGSGNYAWSTKPGPSRTLRMHYEGDDLKEPADALVKIETQGKIVFKLNRKKTRLGKPVEFRGYVYGCGAPVKAGKFVQIEFFNVKSRKWQAGPALVKTKADGSFKHKYKFSSGVTKPVKIKFRVTVPAEDGYACATSTSVQRTIVVTRR